MFRSRGPSSFTSEFDREFEAHTHALLRRRFLWFSGVLAVLAAAALLMSLAAGFAGLGSAQMPGVLGTFSRVMAPRGRTYIAWGLMLLATLAYLSCYLAAKRGRFGREGMLRLTYLIVVVDGALRVSGAWLDAPGNTGLLGVMVAHVLACLFLPWTPGQAVLPMIPVLALAELRWLFEDHDAGSTVVLLAFTPLVAAPGTLLCLLRHSRRISEFKLGFFQRRYGEVRRELVDARRIHEALFPKPITEGPIRFSYLYEPMHLIGGDYLFACKSGFDKSGEPALSLVIMDVTGHGIPAALTVNRLHGELSRIFAEDPEVRPGRVLALLNRYVHLTLANHSVYVTALCLRFDLPENRIEYASGGHPPAYVKAVNGTVHELVSTAFVLGACADPDFRSDAAAVQFGPGDALIAYTDGALEARDDQRKMIGLSGMRRIIAGGKVGAVGEWPRLVLGAVESHRRGPPEDDTLVIEVSRPIEAARPASPAARPREALRT